jgi:hypothetical protein
LLKFGSEEETKKIPPVQPLVVEQAPIAQAHEVSQVPKISDFFGEPENAENFASESPTPRGISAVRSSSEINDEIPMLAFSRTRQCVFGME